MKKFINKTATLKICISKVPFECLVFPRIFKKPFFECTLGYLLAHLSGTERK